LILAPFVSHFFQQLFCGYYEDVVSYFRPSPCTSCHIDMNKYLRYLFKENFLITLRFYRHRADISDFTTQDTCGLQTLGFLTGQQLQGELEWESISNMSEKF
ncbi:unnamed protein product, partial [Bubo scandiacus]